MKKIIKYIFLLVISFFFIINVKADLQDFSGGGSGSTGNMSGEGSWNNIYVGIKVSIVNSSNQVKDVEIFLNSKGKGSNAKFSYDNNPKTHQSSSITWTTSRTTYTADFLPDNWQVNQTSIDLYSILTSNDYENLKKILNNSEVSAGPGDYILIEPMVRIGGYYATAFEHGNAFSLNSNCSSKSSFCYKYAKAVFSGNSNNSGGGVLWTTLKLVSSISRPQLTVNNDDNYSNRRKCFMSSTCGRGIGVFKYDNIYPSNLTIVYHSNGATTKKFNGEIFSDDSIIPKQVVDIGERVSDGLYNIQNPSYLYLENFGRGSTGKWLLGSTSSSTKLDQSTAITWDGVKAKIGNTEIADLSTGSKTIHVYAEWDFDDYLIIYHGNNGYTSDGQSIISNEVRYGDYYEIHDGDLFNRPDHTFIGWTTNSNGLDDGYGWTGSGGIWNYVNGEYGISDNELHLYARWEDSCIYEFNKDSSPANRLKIYKNLHTGAWNSESRRNLLNFKITDAQTACGNYTPSYGEHNACLETDQVNSTTENKFTYENLSDYNDILTTSSTSDKSYCLTDFEVIKGYGINYNSNVKVKAGTMIFNISREDSVANGVLTKTCYIHKDVYSNYVSEITQANFINPDNYISTLTLDGVELIKTISKTVPVSALEGDFYKVTGSVNIQYKPSPVYVEKITGKQSNNCLDGDEVKDSCRLLGYGVASKFNDDSSSTQSFNFSITPADKKIFTFGTGSACEYRVEREIIKYNRSEKGNLDLEFRVIDTKSPFNRNTKSNWSDGLNNNKDNNLVKKYITNSGVNNSYNKTGEGSLYQTGTFGKIILTPDLVQRIRDYNKKNSYNDYTVYVDNIDGEEKTSTSFFDYIGLTKVQ